MSKIGEFVAKRQILQMLSEDKLALIVVKKMQDKILERYPETLLQVLAGEDPHRIRPSALWEQSEDQQGRLLEKRPAAVWPGPRVHRVSGGGKVQANPGRDQRLGQTQTVRRVFQDNFYYFRVYNGEEQNICLDREPSGAVHNPVVFAPKAPRMPLVQFPWPSSILALRWR